MIVWGVQPASAQSFWSPREIVIDTYTPPIRFTCGGETCLAYELHVTNMDRYPVALRSIEVLAVADARVAIIQDGIPDSREWMSIWPIHRGQPQPLPTRLEILLLIPRARPGQGLKLQRVTQLDDYVPPLLSRTSCRWREGQLG
jgi:hypothetical protein